MKRIFLSTIILAGIWAGPAGAFDLTIVTPATQVAQFQLVAAIPYDRQTVSPAPTQYTLRFSQPIRPDRSSIKVLDMYGMRINGADLQSDGVSITTALPALAPGKYTVKWATRCQCDEGLDLGETFHFIVK